MKKFLDYDGVAYLVRLLRKPFSKSSASSWGKAGLVPAPAPGKDNRVLYNNGEWKEIPSEKDISNIKIRPFNIENWVDVDHGSCKYIIDGNNSDTNFKLTENSIIYFSPGLDNMFFYDRDLYKKFQTKPILNRYASEYTNNKKNRLIYNLNYTDSQNEDIPDITDTTLAIDKYMIIIHLLDLFGVMVSDIDITNNTITLIRKKVFIRSNGDDTLKTIIHAHIGGEPVLADLLNREYTKKYKDLYSFFRNDNIMPGIKDITYDLIVS